MERDDLSGITTFAAVSAATATATAITSSAEASDCLCSQRNTL
jgi:hypothetical protein